MSDIIQKTTDYSQGSEGGVMDFMIYVDHGTADAIVWLKSEKTLPNGQPITIPPTKIPRSDSPVYIGTQVTVPAGWTSPITYAYDPNGKPVAADLVFELRVFVVVQQSSGAQPGTRQAVNSEGAGNG